MYFNSFLHNNDSYIIHIYIYIYMCVCVCVCVCVCNYKVIILFDNYLLPLIFGSFIVLT